MHSRDRFSHPLPDSPILNTRDHIGVRSWFREKSLRAVLGTLSWSGLLDDQEMRSVSEIELETLDDDRQHQQRNDASWSWRNASFERDRSLYVPSSPAALMRNTQPQKSGTISEYLTTMATSFIKTTEQLFSSHSSPTGQQPSKSATLFEKLKMAASRTTLYESLTGRAHDGPGHQSERFRPKGASEGNLSGVKDLSKMD